CSGWLRIKKKECHRCGLQLEANFNESPLVVLAREEQDFILDFVFCGGNFRALSMKLGLTYPTVRGHLDRIISKLETIASLENVDGILEAIDQGKIRPDEGIKKLRKLKESSS
ncbi:MAG: DUF2089 family protein, partial [Candidatus Omnitrophica bacterium]|nr:DUF2089 family protein [Candidatus Omnitrophota bacterium]